MFIEKKSVDESKNVERFTEKVYQSPIIEKKIEKKEENSYGLLKRIETDFNSIGFI